MEANERLRQARIEAGYRTATEAAKALRVRPPTYHGHENGSRTFDPATAQHYARVFKVRSGWLLTGEAPKHPVTNGTDSHGLSLEETVDITTTKSLPVLGEVVAGSWLELDPIREYDEPLFEVPVPIDPRFPRGAVYGLVVRGTSINRVAAEGDILVCLDRSAAGFDITDQDLVIVERLRAQDGLREVTAKRAKRSGSRLELWPESDDPRWQEPLSTKVDGDDHIRIIARVEWIFRHARKH